MPHRAPSALPASPWMLVPLLAMALTTLPAPTAAAAGGERWAGIGLTGGIRTFASGLALNAEGAIGLRASVGLSDRVVMMVDAAHANPTRSTSGTAASFGDIRVLSAFRFLSGRWRPYVLAGMGGQFFNFNDAPGSAGGLLAGGVGVDFEPVPRWALFAEASVDVYRAQYVRYDELGRTVESEEAETYGTGAFTAGVQHRF